MAHLGFAKTIDIVAHIVSFVDWPRQVNGFFLSK